MGGRSGMPTMGEIEFLHARRAMVNGQLAERHITDARVLQAFLKVPRHHFVPFEDRARAYEDHPLEIGNRQTISQPYMVAYMLEALQVEIGMSVLEIGTGSGYQTALLLDVGAQVSSVERIEGLLQQAVARLESLGYKGARYLLGDGSLGWVEEAPFDRIIVSAASPEVPAPLVDQLAAGGRLLVPVGTATSQALVLVEKPKDGGAPVERELCHCVFVPLVGAAGWPEREG